MVCFIRCVQQIKKNMDYVVSELKKCQEAMKTGYLSAFPTSWFDRLENLKAVWAPYYTIHKIMAGLYDQHRLAHNPDSLDMAVSMALYFYSRTTAVIKNYTIAHWESMINNEFGGMNEVLYNLYKETGTPFLAEFAHLFDKPVLMGPLAVNADLLTGLHANTHIPEVIGAARRSVCVACTSTVKKTLFLSAPAAVLVHIYNTSSCSVGTLTSRWPKMYIILYTDTSCNLEMSATQSAYIYAKAIQSLPEEVYILDPYSHMKSFRFFVSALLFPMMDTSHKKAQDRWKCP